jgi:hypothetical protein
LKKSNKTADPAVGGVVLFEKSNKTADPAVGGVVLFSFFSSRRRTRFFSGKTTGSTAGTTVLLKSLTKQRLRRPDPLFIEFF